MERGSLGGWIAVYRGQVMQQIADSKPICKAMAWIYLNLKAQHRDYPARLMSRDIQLSRGQLATTAGMLATDWGWSKSQVYRYLDKKVAESLLEKRRVGNTLVLTLTCYDREQTGRDTLRKSQRHTEQPSKTRTTSNKNNHQRQETGCVDHQSTGCPQSALLETLAVGSGVGGGGRAQSFEEFFEGLADHEQGLFQHLFSRMTSVIPTWRRPHVTT